MSDVAASHQFEEVARVAPALEQWLAETRPPIALADLIDLIEEVRPDPGTIGADLGAYSGAAAMQIVDRYGCHMTAIDIAPAPLAAAERSKVSPVNANLQQLPFRTGSLSLVWCRDTSPWSPTSARPAVRSHECCAPAPGPSSAPLSAPHGLSLWSERS
ncbi:MAG: class I SAM-dependent methyltransferase [Actinomycetota bacterium]|nr:class I SAM-dependent methyltransferase [Actinomycetota bacterium]MDQ6947605.1 class I SAM-dependent methyltransferase [Actinomycetota bacterium]